MYIVKHCEGGGGGGSPPVRWPSEASQNFLFSRFFTFLGNNRFEKY